MAMTDFQVRLPKTILGTPNDWESWYHEIKVYALCKDVWKYINPDIIEPSKMQHPQEPRIDTNADAVQIERWKREMAQYDAVLANIASVRALIYVSVDEYAFKRIEDISGLVGEENVQVTEMLTTLRRRYGPKKG